ncbi:ABC transporter permease subunit [Streptomyces sp. NPDC091280]|uniref:ABC transporter permease subunit n=1 Tax=Streptomyces sp. NPDC091280 TaxID=3365984 RepID=UPI00380A5299
MRRPLHAEWTKLRTLPSTWWLLTATVVLTAALGATAAASVTTRVCPTPCDTDTVKLTLSGVQLSQATCLVLGALSMGAEYSTGTIRTTLTAMPGRWRVLASKAAVLSLLTAVAGALGVLSSLGLAHLILPTPPHGAPLRPTTGSILILVLVTLLGLSLATLLRDTAAAITLGLGILYVVPILANLINSPTWQHRLQRWSPMPAALSVQATKHLNTLAIAPWPGLGVLAAYATALLALGGVWFRLRDA